MCFPLGTCLYTIAVTHLHCHQLSFHHTNFQCAPECRQCVVQDCPELICVAIVTGALRKKVYAVWDAGGENQTEGGDDPHDFEQMVFGKG